MRTDVTARFGSHLIASRVDIVLIILCRFDAVRSAAWLLDSVKGTFSSCFRQMVMYFIILFVCEIYIYFYNILITGPTCILIIN